MADPFGNYLCQKLLEHCNDVQRYSILRRVSTDLVQISMNAHGTRAVQKLIDTIHTQDEIETIQREFRPCVVQMIQDSNSNHVIQRCLNKLSPQDKQFIYDAVTEGENIVKVATHRHGCCVLQRCIDHASEQQKLQIINEIVKHAFALVQDPFGNYVVQYILDLGLAEVPKKLAVHLKGHFVELSTQKFSSNVVEKIMQSSDPAAIETVVAEVIAYKKIDLLLQDPYANYVIQTALTRSSDKQHKELSDAILCHIAVLRTTPYGKRIQAKMHRDSSSSGTIPSVYSTHNSH